MKKAAPHPAGLVAPLRIFFALFIAACLALSLTRAAEPPAVKTTLGQGNSLQYLAQLYSAGQYFELRDVMANLNNLPAPWLDFYRGVLDESFNRLDSAVACLQSFLKSAPPRLAPSFVKEALALIADAYRRQGRYRKSAEAHRTILERFGPGLDADERAGVENQEFLWASLADVPPQTIEITGDSNIRMENGHLPVEIGGRTLFLSLDTGSNLSILVQSAADELGLGPLGPTVKIQSATGRWVDARAVVVPEMRLGHTVIRTAVFLVLPDRLFYERWFSGEGGRHGILGAPVLAALREFTWTRDGLLLIPASPQHRPIQNMCFFGFTPIVEVAHRGFRLPFILDTGSRTTFLTPPFLNRFRGEITSRSKARKGLVGGLGSERTIRVYVLDVFDFGAGGRDIALRRVIVHSQVTYSGSTRFFGTIGLDILDQASRMTVNFDSMSFILE